MKRTFLFILLVCGLSLQAQHASSTNVVASASGRAAASLSETKINLEVGQGAMRAQGGETKTVTGTPSVPQEKALPELQLEKSDRDLRLTRSVSYSGVVVDLRRVGEVTELFSLRRPLDPNREFKNILLDVQTERPRGTVLFSLNF